MTQINSMREIIFQQNSFFGAVKIIPVFGITSNEKKQVKDIISKYLHFTGMEPIRETESEGKYSLVTTQNNCFGVNEK